MKRLVFVLWGLVCCYELSGQVSKVQVSSSDSMIALTPFASAFVDSTDALAFDRISSQKFSPIPALFLTQGAQCFWVKLVLQSDLSAPSDWRLSLYDDWCETVDIYTQSAGVDGQWLHQRAGNLCPINQLDQQSGVLNMTQKRPHEVSISLEPAVEKHLYIRYKCQYRQYLRVNLTLKPMILAANEVSDYKRNMFFTIAFICVLWVLALYHLLFFYMVRDVAYFYYALYGFTAPIAMTVMDSYNNFYYHLFYKNLPHIYPWIFNNSGIVAVAFYILFTRSFLHTKVRFPKLDKAILLLLGLAICSGIIGNVNFVITQRQYLPGMPFGALIVLITVVFGILSVTIWKTKRGTDIFYLLGVGVILVTLFPKYCFLLFHEQYEAFEFEWLYPEIVHFGLILELLIFALGLGYRTRQIQLEKQRYAELDEMKSRFFANISHEFRTPLTLILGPINQVLEQIKDPKSRSLLQVADKNAQRLLQLINQILDLAKLEAKKMSLQASSRDFLPHLKGIVYAYESLAKQQGIELSLDCPAGVLPLYYDAEKMESILYNLLSNALKFTPEGGFIAIQVLQKTGIVELRIQDSGVGIPSDRLPKIFDRFFQAESGRADRSEGTGIGLAMVQELVHLHQGSIHVESTEGIGTVFTLVFLAGKAHLNESEIAPTSTAPKIKPALDILALGGANTSNNNPVAADKSAPKILLIEDNLHVRAYIRQCLEDKYQILEAEDGADGIKKAIKYGPDLIISDVMMPKKNGYEVCDTLKTDIRTSHIPVILLTARAAREEKIMGLKTGADAYLIKPFESQELNVRVQNLIHLRQQLRERFASAISLKPSEVVSTSLDKAFLEKAVKIVETNIQNEQFNIDILAQNLNMSKPNLNRKLQALLHQSSNQFIQSIRLQRAANLLRDQSGTIAEIAYQTGFSSTAYFVKCFKAHFGVTPGQFFKKDG